MYGALEEVIGELTTGLGLMTNIKKRQLRECVTAFFSITIFISDIELKKCQIQRTIQKIVISNILRNHKQARCV